MLRFKVLLRGFSAMFRLCFCALSSAFPRVFVDVQQSLALARSPLNPYPLWFCFRERYCNLFMAKEITDVLATSDMKTIFFCAKQDLLFVGICK